uniref:Zinc transporter ZIP1 n=1 Tax=Helobdella robusta TaxID=6412 RepID=T1EI29_HELRO
MHAKIVAGVVMLFSILICFLLPIKLNVFFKKRGDKGQYYLDLLTCFAGGVFLAVYLIFMAPAVRDLILENLMIPNNISYPLPDVLIGVGFFLMLILNRVVVSFKSSTSICINNGQKLTSDSVIVDDSELDNIITIFDPNNPFPLARRSSITDVAHQDSAIRSVLMMLALSLDSVFEGLTTGLKTTTMEVWAIFIGNMVHETIIAFCLGLQLVKIYKNRKLPVIISAVAYSLMNPVGLAIATVCYESQGSGPTLDLISGFIQGVTSGCFIYVTFCEILEGQITHQMAYGKIFSMLAGFIIL